MMRCLPLLILAGILVAEQAPDVPITRRRQLPIRLVTDNIDQVVSATLWVSTDEGRTWQQATTITRPQPADQAIVFSFEPDEERLYGFHTTEVLADGRREEAPSPGSTPTVSVIFDFTPPEITAFTVTPIAHRLDTRTVTVEWASTDVHPHAQAARLERQEGDDWQAVSDWLPSSGEMTVDVAATAVLRVQVRDRAGNQAASEPWQPPSDDAPQTVSRPTRPRLEPAPPATPVDDEPVSTIDPRPDVTESAMTQPTTAVVLPLSIPVFGEDLAHPTLPPDIERDFRAAQRARREGRDPQLPPRFTGQQEHSSPPDRPRTEATPRSPLPSDGSPPETVLRLARAEVTAGHDDQALILYRRLADSPLAAIGLAEELVVMERLGRRAEALHLVHTSPPEALSDTVRCIQVRLKLAQRDHDGARRILRLIPLDSPERRQAQFLEAQLLFAIGDRNTARAVLRRLGRGDDVWAAAARAVLEP